MGDLLRKMYTETRCRTYTGLDSLLRAGARMGLTSVAFAPRVLVASWVLGVCLPARESHIETPSRLGDLPRPLVLSTSPAAARKAEAQGRDMWDLGNKHFARPPWCSLGYKECCLAVLVRPGSRLVSPISSLISSSALYLGPSQDFPKSCSPRKKRHRKDPNSSSKRR